MVVFCTVNYKDYKSTKSFIESYISLRLSNSMLIIVDNEANIEEHTNIKLKYANYKQILFLSSPKNLGYFGAAFMALEYFNREFGSFDYFCITNNDITFDINSDWEGVLNEYTTYNIGCIAPRILSTSSGLNQNPFHNVRPTVNHYLKFHYIFKSYLVTKTLFSLRKYLAKKNKLKKTITKPISIYAAQGAFFILSYDFFESGYDIEGIPFLYSEEITVAEHCLKNKLSIIYEPRLSVYHNEHQATGSSMSRFKYSEMKKSVKFILRNFYK